MNTRAANLVLDDGSYQVRNTLQNFKLNIQMLGLDGKVEMTHTISELKNPTSAVTREQTTISQVFRYSV